MTSVNELLASQELWKLKAKERLFFSDEVIEQHSVLTKPESSDWLASHNEPGQSFIQYRKDLSAKLPKYTVRVINHSD